MPKYAKPKKSGSKKQNSLTPWFIGGGLLFVLLIALAVYLNSDSGNAVAIEQRDVDVAWNDRTSLGNPEAVVVVEAWEDFMCPACQQWASQIEPQIYEEYVKPGLVRLEFHQFPLTMHAPGAQMGAMASECAADQGQFWPYHDRLFLEAASRGQAGLQLERLVDYADDLSMDTTAFRQCLTTQQHRSTVDASVSEAISLGLNSTPSIRINEQLVDAPFDYNSIRAQIDGILAAAGISKE